MKKTQPTSWWRLLSVGALAALGLVGLLSALGLIYFTVISSKIDQRIEQLRSTRSSKFYALYPALEVDKIITPKALERMLQHTGYKRGSGSNTLAPRQFYWENKHTLHLSRPPFSGKGYPLRKDQIVIKFDAKDLGLEVESITSKIRDEKLSKFEFAPKQLGYFFAGRLRNQHSVSLSEIPVSLRLAIIAIEDVHFLEHIGVSFKGTLRALWTDILAMKWAQGGSTITQQLMKNLFFSREKLLSRKIKEAFYAFVTEARYDKEVILEAYLNEVYFGQWNTHEIHGVSEASRYYFNRAVADLSLAESATLAAIIQVPNVYNPHKFPDRVMERRNLVLKKMAEVEFILPSEYKRALNSPLGVASPERNLADAAYFMEAALESLPNNIKDRLDTDSLSIYVSLNPILQDAASESLSSHIKKMENYFDTLKQKKEEGIFLQGALVAIDVGRCAVVALQGGRNFREAPFNRAIRGKRQPGSLFKPFVYLSAYSDPPEEPFHAKSMLLDEPFEWKYDRQVWIPRNYDEEFKGPVSFQEALQKSMNVPTAWLAKQIGLKPIVANLKKAGIESNVPQVPSISLGAAEVTPIEMANAYTSLARIGRRCVLRNYWTVYDDQGKLVTESSLVDKQTLDREPTYQTVKLLKGVLTNGTAKSTQKSGMDLSNFAGKTGTTNDFKDAWFVGFSPELLVLVWVGYDVQESVGFPGAVAALPVWIDFMRTAFPFLEDIDFDSSETYSPNVEKG